MGLAVSYHPLSTVYVKNFVDKADSGFTSSTNQRQSEALSTHPSPGFKVSFTRQFLLKSGLCPNFGRRLNEKEYDRHQPWESSFKVFLLNTHSLIGATEMQKWKWCWSFHHNLLNKMFKGERTTWPQWESVVMP